MGSRISLGNSGADQALIRRPEARGHSGLNNPVDTWRNTMKHIIAVATLGFLVLGTSAFAQEHPEHPKENKKQAKQTEATEKMTLDELADAITRYIDQDSKLKGGSFLIYDAEEKKPLMLKLERVHKERLSTLGGGLYFACTDMKHGDGTVYDLDFFMKRTPRGVETTEVAIHKKAGKPRYAWREQDGIWNKVKS